ncbi:hypothetical protein ACFQL4_17280 [Halosimplex aquaticum]
MRADRRRRRSPAVAAATPLEGAAVGADGDRPLAVVVDAEQGYVTGLDRRPVLADAVVAVDEPAVPGDQHAVAGGRHVVEVDLRVPDADLPPLGVLRPLVGGVVGSGLRVVRSVDGSAVGVAVSAGVALDLVLGRPVRSGRAGLAVSRRIARGIVTDGLDGLGEHVAAGVDGVHRVAADVEAGDRRSAARLDDVAEARAAVGSDRRREDLSGPVRDEESLATAFAGDGDRFPRARLPSGGAVVVFAPVRRVVHAERAAGPREPDALAVGRRVDRREHVPLGRGTDRHDDVPRPVAPSEDDAVRADGVRAVGGLCDVAEVQVERGLRFGPVAVVL